LQRGNKSCMEISKVERRKEGEGHIYTQNNRRILLIFIFTC
jgi:hypothetical protein